jgi:hypothetical protein
VACGSAAGQMCCGQTGCQSPLFCGDGICH